MNLSAEVVELRAHRDRRIPPGALRKLFDHVGWDRPAQDEGVAAVLEAGPAVGAWRGEDLIGFARALRWALRCLREGRNGPPGMARARHR
jgi:hypothetical protein